MTAERFVVALIHPLARLKVSDRISSGMRPYLEGPKKALWVARRMKAAKVQVRLPR